MTTDAHAHANANALELSYDDGAPTPFFVALALALVAHVAFARLAHRVAHVERAPATTEIELAKFEEPPAPTPPVTPEVAPAPAAAAPPPAVRAAALLTRRDDAPSKATADAPLDFVTDPQGTSYGSGVVARGGTDDVGVHGASAAPSASVLHKTTVVRTATPGAATGDALTPPADLSRPARLTVRDPCRGRYSTEATDDAGEVTLALIVRASGEVASAAIVDESLRGQGFGAAAKACLVAQRMSPAQDKSGASVAAAATIAVRFSR